jgi:hypothetical protein
MIPRKVKVTGGVLAALRLAAVLTVLGNQSTDAQWQLAYLPFWVTDLPISVLYGFFPPPLPELIAGPIWWYFLPILLWTIYARWRVATTTSNLP